MAEVAKDLNMLKQLLEFVANSPKAAHRLIGWDRSICWKIEDKVYYWKAFQGKLSFAEPAEEPDFVLDCSLDTLEKVVSGKLPLFLGLWATEEIRFQGTFADAFHLGYIFLNDGRAGRVLFLAHCFLNTNTRFPGGSTYPGATEPLIQFLLSTGVGLIQMPCPEFQCLGLEKELYGELAEIQLRQGFRQLAEAVVDQIQAYLGHNYKVLGILGMNPSPSCGVEITKGKDSMLGRGGDLCERNESGAFIEELRKILTERGLNTIPVYGFRRLLPGEAGATERLAKLRNQFCF